VLDAGKGGGDVRCRSYYHSGHAARCACSRAHPSLPGALRGLSGTTGEELQRPERATTWGSIGVATAQKTLTGVSGQLETTARLDGMSAGRRNGGAGRCNGGWSAAGARL
jgi:hypothetical protein